MYRSIRDSKATMHNKLRQLIFIALKRNEFTARLPLRLSLRGYDVIVEGEVDSEASIYEVVATIESVSPYLRVRSRMTVSERAPAGV